MSSRVAPPGSVTGSFPLLEHVVLLRSELPRQPSQDAAATATLEPIRSLATTAATAPAAVASSESLLETEPALRALLTSFTSELMLSQRRQRQQSRTIKQLYANLEVALDESSPRASASSPVTSRTPERVSLASTSTAVNGSAASLNDSSQRRVELEDATMRVSAPRPNAWSLLPVSKEGLYIQVPSRGFVRACRDWAAETLMDMSSATSSSAPASAGCSKPARTSASVCYADTQHYYATRVSPMLHRNESSSTMHSTRIRTRNDEGYLYGYAMYLHGDIFFPDLIADPETERGLLLLAVSTSPVFNFSRRVVLETAQQLCSAAKSVVAAAASSSTPQRLAALMLAVMSQVLEPLRELTDPCSAACLTPPGRPMSLKLALPDDYSNERSSGNAGDAARTPVVLHLKRPADLLCPHLDTPLAVLLLSFPYDAIRILHSLLLQEARIIIIGATAQHAAACAVAAPALMVPLSWSCPLIPYVSSAHIAACGLLDTLLGTSVEMEARRRHARSQNRAAPTAATSSKEPDGYMLGASPSIVPQLMLRLSAIAATAAREDEVSALGSKLAGSDSRLPTSQEKSRVWIADARTGSIGVVPLEPLSLIFSRAETTSTSSGSAGSKKGNGHADASTHRVSFPTRTEFQRRVLKQATSQNAATVSSFTLLDILPAADKLRAAVGKAVTAEQRLAFRVALEAMVSLDANRRSSRTEEQEQLELLLRMIEFRLDENADVEDEVVASEQNNTSLATGDGDDGSSCRSSSSNSEREEVTGSGVTSCTVSAASPSLTPRPVALVSNTQNQQQQQQAHRNANMRSIVPAFPSIATARLIEVHAALLDFNTQKLFGNYRRGILRNGSDVVGINMAAFLSANLNNSFRMAEAITRTHACTQFAQALACVETLGLASVLRGDFIPAALTAPLSARGQSFVHTSSRETTSSTSGSRAYNYYVSHPRMVCLVNLFIERSRRRYPDMFPELGTPNGTTSSSTAGAYSSVMAVANDGVASSHRIAVGATTPSSNTSSSHNHTDTLVTAAPRYFVPGIAFLAGYEGTALDSGYTTSTAAAGGGSSSSSSANHQDPYTGVGVGHPSVPSAVDTSVPFAAAGNSNSGGGSGKGGVRSFFAKATRAVRHGLSGGGGGGAGAASSTTHVSTIPIAVYVQAVSCFAAASWRSAVQSRPHGWRQRRRAKRRPAALAAQVQRRNGQQQQRRGFDGVTIDGSHSPNPSRRHRRCTSRHSGSNRHSATDAAPLVEASVQAAASSEVEENHQQHKEERAALEDAFAQQQVLAEAEFTMPEALNASDQALIASAAAASVGEDGVALGSSDTRSSCGAGAVVSDIGGGNGAEKGGASHQGGGYGDGRDTYVSGMGIEGECMRQMALSGGNAISAMDGVANCCGPLGPVLCRPLPLDVVHQFASYHPLLSVNASFATVLSASPRSRTSPPACVTPTVDSREALALSRVRTLGEGVALEPADTISYLSPFVGSSPRILESGKQGPHVNVISYSGTRTTSSSPHARAQLYALLATLCPSAAAMWRTAAQLAEAALLASPSQPPPERQESEKQKHLALAFNVPQPVGKPQHASTRDAESPPTTAPAAASNDLWSLAAAPSVSVAVSPSLATTASAPGTVAAQQRRAIFDELFDAPPETTTTSKPSGSIATTAPAAGNAAALMANWGTFTSGVPDGFSLGVPSQVPSVHPARLDTTAARSAVCACSPSSPLPARQAVTAGSNSSTTWEMWGMRASTTEVHSHASTPALATGASPSSVPLVPSTGCTSGAPPPVAARAPGDVMDELFSFTSRQQPATATKQPAFDDYFR